MKSEPNPVSYALAALRWQVRKRAMHQEVSRLDRLADELGAPRGDLREAVAGSVSSGASLAPQTVRSAPAPNRQRLGSATASVVAASVCTRSHLHLSRAMVASLAAVHPEMPIFVLLLDGDESERQLIPGARVLLARDLEFPEPYDLLKLTAFQACAASKAPLIVRLIDEGASAVVFLDSDIQVYSPLRNLLAPLADADLVAVPHMREPFPPHAWERPTFEQITQAGVFNSGLFAVRGSAAGRRFMRQWGDMLRDHGAFGTDFQAIHEQRGFNWAAAFVEHLHVVRSPAVNVAYWNLHERALKRVSQDATECWKVDGEPLESFHFSGFQLERPDRISQYDGRHPSWSHGEISRLLADYAEQLRAHGAEARGRRAYRFDRFPSGIAIDARMRHLFNRYELHLWCDLDPFTEAGERHYCQTLLLPDARGKSLLPLLLQQIWWERADLRASMPDVDLDPRPLLRWFAEHGARELGYQQLLDRHRPTLPTLAGMLGWVRARKLAPDVFEGVEEPLGADRGRFVRRLARSGLKPLADELEGLQGELWALSPVWMLRVLYEQREDLQTSFVEPLFEDAEAFAIWIEECGSGSDFLPSACAPAFRRTAGDRSLVRIFSFLSRDWEKGRVFATALCGESPHQLARVLFESLEHQPEYDLDDIAMYLWLMATRPAAGLHLALELMRLFPEPGSDVTTLEDQDRRLQPVLAADPEAVAALATIRRRQQQAGRLPARRPAIDARGPSVYRRLGSAAASVPRPGVNVFGYSRSPIGLGTMSRGLLRSVAAAGIRYAEIVLTTHAMDDELRLEDMVDRFDPELGTNLFVSYPHLEVDLLRFQPQERIRGRRNIAYLAWELGRGNPEWARVYEELDQIWALSTFTAESLAGCLRRKVHAVPCVVDVDALPPPVTLGELGFDRRRFTALTVFDASSSTERKNPEAVVAAFERAFRVDDRARLIVRVANGTRRDHLRRVRALQDQARRTGLDIRFLTARLSHREVLSLISACDCYLSLHRAEGFGLTCAEAMAYGKPVVATGASGNLEFMSDENSYLVPADDSQVRISEGPFRRGMPWFEPRVDTAAELLRQVHDQPEAARAVGRVARRHIAATLGASTIGRRVAALLGEPVASAALKASTALAGAAADEREVAER
ncbi:MAG: glycosyltransferase family 4 protein [Acidobacteriota bacterium]